MPVTAFRAFVCTLALMATCTAMWLPIGSVLRGDTAHLTTVADDFFYYSIPAHSIVENGKSTFDGLSETNGYHPLWMGCIIAIEMFSSGDTKSYWFILFSVLGLLSATTFIAMRRLAEDLF